MDERAVSLSWSLSNGRYRLYGNECDCEQLAGLSKGAVNEDVCRRTRPH